MADPATTQSPTPTRATGSPAASGRGLLIGRSSSDDLIADDGDIDRVLCGDGFADVAFTDTGEEEISGCETRKSVGTLRLTPKVVRAEPGETTRLKLSWRHPKAWKQLRTTRCLRPQDPAAAPVGAPLVQRTLGGAEGDLQAGRHVTPRSQEHPTRLGEREEPRQGAGLSAFKPTEPSAAR